MLDSVSLSLGGVAGVKKTTDDARKNLDTTYDQFLTLLTTQLKNQDPLNPMDTKDMTNQLIALAEVEQSIAQTDKMNELIQLNQTSAINSTLLGYIGMNVEYKGADFTYRGGSALQFDYTIGKNAASAKVEILDNGGAVVWTGTAKTAEGSHSIIWNGTKTDGTLAAEGKYKIKVSAFDSNNAPVTATTPVPDFNYSRAATSVPLKYTLNEAANKSKISIFNTAGELVYSADGEKTKGDHTFTWSGVDKNGKPASVGSYYIEVGATDKEGKAIKTATTVPANVGGVEIVDGKVMLVIGNQKVPIDKVQSVRLPG
jgi:flagellar basal-body rod modification protein FlgD